MTRLTNIVASDNASQSGRACTISRTTPRRSTLDRNSASSPTASASTRIVRRCERIERASLLYRSSGFARGRAAICCCCQPARSPCKMRGSLPHEESCCRSLLRFFTRRSARRPPDRHGKVRDIYDFGESPADRRHRSDLGVRLRARIGHSRQGQGPHADLRLLVRAHAIDRRQSRRVDRSARLPERELGAEADLLAGRSMLVRRTEPLPIECVARGYLSGSGWKDYRRHGTGLRHRAAGRPARVGPAARADLHAGHQGAERPRHQHQRSRGRAAGRTRTCSRARAS